MSSITVNSIDDPSLDVFRSLKKTNRTRHDRLFVVEGATVTKRLLNSDYQLHSLLVTEGRFEEFSSITPADATLVVVPKALASELVGFKFHMGVLAAAYRKPAPSPADILPATGPSLVLYGDQIIDQQNVGMIIRIGAAFGATAVIFGPGSADPYSRRVTKVSMGNGLFMPVVESAKNKDTLTDLQTMNYKIFAAVLDSHAEELSPSTFSSRTVIVLGNETNGISREVLDKCDTRITIAMLNDTDSINVAIATGIFSHSYRTQFPATTPT